MRVKSARRINLPRLRYWNYGPCQHHEAPEVSCQYRRCGGDFFAHQTRSIAFLYHMGRGMDASVTGAGKTLVALGLVALLKERGEASRVLIICQTPAVQQWVDEAGRWLVGLRVVGVTGMSREQRHYAYATRADVLIMGYHIALKDRRVLLEQEFGLVVSDDVDPLLNSTSQTHKIVAMLSQRAPRSVVFNATSIQTNLVQLHSALTAAGGMEVLGTQRQFERSYVRREPVFIWVRSRRIKTFKTVGYRNIEDLKARLNTLVIRNTYDDFAADSSMPELLPPENVWLDLHPPQRAKYDELQEGVVRLLRAEGGVKFATALTKITYGQQICAGLPALGEPDGPEASVKLDWVMGRLTGEWASEKVVVFLKNLGMVRALQARCDAAGIGYATVWGEEPAKDFRASEIKRFWEDPECRVMIGTSALERSLNLQVARILVCVDSHLNPGRMTQLAGRIRRTGSRHGSVLVVNLFIRDTQEERYDLVLRSRQAIADAVWEESSEMFEALTPDQLLALIKP